MRTDPVVADCHARQRRLDAMAGGDLRTYVENTHRGLDVLVRKYRLRLHYVRVAGGHVYAPTADSGSLEVADAPGGHVARPKRRSQRGGASRRQAASRRPKGST